MNHIYFTGYDALHPADFIYDVSEGHDCYLLLITSTPARFWVDGSLQEYPAHSAVLYAPHEKIWYGACAEHYGNDWIRFDSDESFVKNFPQTAHPFPVSDPEYCHGLFQMLTWETSQWLNISRSCHNTGTDTIRDIESNTLTGREPNQSEQIISQLLRILFHKLHNDALHHTISPHDHELLMLRKQISNNPGLNWNVHDMAEQLHLSMGYLQFLYKQKFGISCMDDVIECRLRKARDLLAYSDQSIAAIAEQCGYRNLEHFCRQFRKNMGLSPGQYRASS